VTASEPKPADGPSAFALLRDPIRLSILATIVVSLFFLAFPGVDLWFTGLFYDPVRGFAATSNPALIPLRNSGDWALGIVVVVLLAAVVLKIALPWRRSVIAPASTVFVLATLILGPGLLVNLILKNNWGRPRPSTVVDFGGSFPYVDVWQIAGYCARNCSFVSGEGSSAIWLTTLAFIAPRRWRLPLLVVTGIWAVALSLNRIAFGAHFLSDVLLAWTLTALVMAIAYRLLFIRPPAWLAGDRLEAGLTRLGYAIRRKPVDR
jgi:membrane-associated PAP2 superfamily phosphatase